MEEASKINRREFLAGTVAAATSLFAAPGIGRPESWDPQEEHSGNLIELPKAGGAVSGLGETFSFDPFTGTQGIAIPLGLSAGRDGYSPDHSLRYSTATGNGSFGIGWSLDIPSIQRRTQGGLPRYDDSDVFLLGSNELVPDGEPFRRGVFEVQRYLQKHETLFSPIERWEARNRDHLDISPTFWRVTTRENVTSWFGLTSGALLAHPGRDRIFRWSLQISGDGKGNYIHYVYKPDESSRGECCQIYPKRILYGNRSPVQVGELDAAIALASLGPRPGKTLFETVFDYGEHGGSEEGIPVVSDDLHAERSSWLPRPDSVVSFRPGFESATRRLCRRILMFHHLPGEAPLLVSSMEFVYEPQPVTQIAALTVATHRRYQRSAPGKLHFSEDYDPATPSGVRSVGYDVATMPPLRFAYSVFEAPTAADIHPIQSPSRSAPPRGLSDRRVMFIDLFGRGLPDIVESGRTGYRYWKNHGLGRFSEPRPLSRAPAEIVFGQPGVGISNLTQHPFPEILVMRGNRLAYCEAVVPTPDSDRPFGWKDPRRIPESPSIFDTRNRRLKLLDMTGDGRLDGLLDTFDRFLFFECLGEDGYRLSGEAPRVADLADPWLRLADMTGDGLKDIVRIDVPARQVHYWPNLGRGWFGDRRTLGNSPPLPLDSKLVFLADVDGSGPADLISVRSGRVDYWLNRSGESWSDRVSIEGTPLLSPDFPPRVVDLLGNGTQCLVWSGAGGFASYRYMPLTMACSESESSGVHRVKPLLLCSSDNGRGSQTLYRHRSSTDYVIEAEAAGLRWRTWLPSPVFVVSGIERRDEVGRTRLSSRLAYADGTFDEERRQFIGFGRVWKWDVETLGKEQRSSPPVKTASWFHTGWPTVRAGFDSARYYGGDAAPHLAPGSMPADLQPKERWEAHRGLSGKLLHRAIFAEDGPERAAVPFSTSEHRYRVRRVRGAFHTHRAEFLELHYERDASSPRMSHNVVLSVDELGHIEQEVSVTYPRGGRRRRPGQDHGFVTYTRRRFAARTEDPRGYRHGMLAEETEHELTSLSLRPDAPVSESELWDALARASPIGFEDQPGEIELQLRLVASKRTRYWNDDADGPLPFGQVGLQGLTHTSWQLAFTPGLLRNVYGARVSEAVLSEGGYVRDEAGRWWIPSGHPTRGEACYDAARFYLKTATIDPFGAETRLSYDALDLLLREVVDAAGNRRRADYDYRLQLPTLVEDENGNRSAAAYDTLGVVIATAAMGKPGEEVGDVLSGFDPVPEPGRVRAALAFDPAAAGALLGEATTRVVYDLWGRLGLSNGSPGTADSPMGVWTLSRDRHTRGGPGGTAQVQHSLRYFDGFGRELQAKTGPVSQAGGVQVDPEGPVWAASGRFVFDDKGNVIERYEPFFAGRFEFERRNRGAAVRLVYDPVGRLVETRCADGSVARSRFDAWMHEESDQNDTLDESNRWYRARSEGSAAERRAARQAIAHAGTPRLLHLDALGREYLEEQDNGPEGTYVSRTRFDIRGRALDRIDPRGNVATSARYDAAGRALLRRSIDSATQRILPDVSGRPIRRWDEDGHRIRLEYDALRRRTRTYVRRGGRERLAELRVYGEQIEDAHLANLRGRLHRHFDNAGLVTNERYDFKGNLERSRRTLARHPDPDWSRLGDAEEPDLLDPDLGFTTAWKYDAANHILRTEQPDGGRVERTYDALGRIREIRVRGPEDEGWTPVLRRSTYDPRGKPVTLVLGNGVTTHFEHDPLNLRLRRRRSVRHRDGKVVEDVQMTYDAVGNPIEIWDAAQLRVVRSNQVVEPRVECVYDALYRLVSCSGREHPGQAGTGATRALPLPEDGSAHPADARALESYSERFRYDEAGNLLEVVHRNGTGGWRRTHMYSKTSNRLRRVIIHPRGNGAREEWEVEHDASGNMVRTPTLSRLDWNHERRLTRVQLGHEGNGDYAWYAYAEAGKRIRKQVRRGPNVDERIYIGDFEVFVRRRAGRVVLRRHTLQIAVDDLTRIALHEYTMESAGRTTDEASARVRYQLCQQDGSVYAELDPRGMLISREEYHAFGTTACLWTASAGIALPKRYRYAGKERDEETGFYYFGERYYDPAMARWTNPDPLGDAEGLNEYAFCRNSPIRFRDPDGLQSRDTADPSDRREENKLEGWPVERTTEATTTFGVDLKDATHKTTIHFHEGSEIIANRGGSRRGRGAPRVDSESSKAASGGTQGPKAAEVVASGEPLSESGSRSIFGGGANIGARLTHNGFVREAYQTAVGEASAEAIGRFGKAGSKISLAKVEKVAREAVKAGDAIKARYDAMLDPVAGALTKLASTVKHMTKKRDGFESKVAEAMQKVDPKAVGQTERRVEALKDITVDAGKTSPRLDALGRASKALGPVIAGIGGSVAAEGLIDDVQSGDVAGGFGNGLDVAASVITVAAAGAGSAGMAAAGGALGSAGLGYRVGEWINESWAEGAIDRYELGSGPGGQWYYETFLR